MSRRHDRERERERRAWEAERRHMIETICLLAGRPPPAMIPPPAVVERDEDAWLELVPNAAEETGADPY